MLSGGRKAGEGENVFGQGSMTGIAISVFVKNPDAPEQGRILFHDIGDYLDRRQKLDNIKRFGSIRGIEEAGRWSRITPDEHGDWLDQRDASFGADPVIGDKKCSSGEVLFRSYSLGVATNRDVWCVNPSRGALIENIESTIAFYNAELERWEAEKRARRIDRRARCRRSMISLPQIAHGSVGATPSKQDLKEARPSSVVEGVFVPVYVPALHETMAVLQPPSQRAGRSNAPNLPGQ